MSGGYGDTAAGLTDHVADIGEQTRRIEHDAVLDRVLDAAAVNGWLNEQPGLRERLLTARARGGDYVF